MPGRGGCSILRTEEIADNVLTPTPDTRVRSSAPLEPHGFALHRPSICGFLELVGCRPLISTWGRRLLCRIALKGEWHQPGRAGEDRPPDPISDGMISGRPRHEPRSVACSGTLSGRVRLRGRQQAHHLALVSFASGVLSADVAYGRRSFLDGPRRGSLRLRMALVWLPEKSTRGAWRWLQRPTVVLAPARTSAHDAYEITLDIP